MSGTQLGSRFDDAITFARDAHADQRRKGTEIPYLAHLLAVAAIVLEAGGSEDEAIAALLHDTAEDAGGEKTLDQVRERFGDVVADIVAACSDTFEQPKPPWRERKEAYLAHLDDSSTTDGALLVSLADKLHNARAIVFDLREQGEALWTRFSSPNGGRDQLWYYRALADVFTRRCPGGLAEELSRVVGEMERLGAVERLPDSTPWRERFPDAVLVREFEGGAIYAAETPEGWWLIIDEGTMADLLDEEDRDLANVLVKIERFDDRDAWARAVDAAGEGEARRSAPEPSQVAREVSLQDRIRGCLLAGAVGDALGAPIEFDGIDGIRGRFGPDGLTDFAADDGLLGAITDDTQMTLFTAEGLIRANNRMLTKGICHPPTVVDHAYARWLVTQGETSGRWNGKCDGWLFAVGGLHHRRAPGNTCISALRESEAGTIDKPCNDSKGCGGVMRAAPAGLLAGAAADGPFRLGAELAALTHGHPSGYIAAGALAEIIGSVCGGSALRPAVERAHAQAATYDGAEEVTGALTSAVALADLGGPHGPEAVASLGAGWIAEEALAIAVYCALVAEDMRHGLLLAVNHGGDSDSTGAITGNILGALHGVEAIPAAWREGIELRSTIETLAEDWCAAFASSDPPDPEEDRSWWERYPGW